MATLDRVTITGADDSVEPRDLVALTRRYPFVEWGILLSATQENSPRFPSQGWIRALSALQSGGPQRLPALCGHLCGRWVRDLCVGKLSVLDERPHLTGLFHRVQLNFHGKYHDADMNLMHEALLQWGREEYIFQLDGENDGLGPLVAARGIGARIRPLFDRSGGAGVEPDYWPSPVTAYCGYAGGLHPDRLAEQLPRIQAAAGDSRIWIDVETHVRSDGDRMFDLDKVARFLAAAEPFVAR